MIFNSGSPPLCFFYGTPTTRDHFSLRATDCRCMDGMENIVNECLVDNIEKCGTLSSEHVHNYSMHMYGIYSILNPPLNLCVGG